VTSVDSRDRSVTYPRFTNPDKILSYLETIYPESEYPAKIADYLKIPRSSVRKALERLRKKDGLVENIPYSPYRLSKNYFSLLERSVTTCDIEEIDREKLAPILLKNFLQNLSFSKSVILQNLMVLQ